jgi:SAM-dependent methyltransferase
MSNPQLESYEQVPYESNPFAITHPDGMAVIALLHGMTPASARRCRVLELGCAGGGNLIPMAVAFPESRFVGIDLSPRQVAMGQARLETLGLANIELKAMSILDVDDSLGSFDYIICHGVFSWVPPAVQEKILDICRRLLAPQGVAYVSYNTYPGWHLWSLVRGMLSFHASHFSDTPTKIHQARAMLALLGEALKDSSELYGQILAQQVEETAKHNDSYLFHEHLEDVNTPAYFHEFVERATTHSLQYLEEAHFSQPMPSAVPAAVRDVLQRMPVDLIHREQYLDFLRGRTFRRTLLCQKETVVRRPPAVEVVKGLCLTAHAQPSSAVPDVFSTAPEEFRRPDGRTVKSNDPMIKAALTVLAERWPAPVPFATLWQDVEQRLAQGPESARVALDRGPQPVAEAMLGCYVGHMLEMYVDPPRFTLEPGPRPTASALARLQAAAGDPLITSLRHANVELNPFDRAVVSCLDGSRDAAAIESLLAEMVAGDRLAIQADGKQLKDPAQVTEIIHASLPRSLHRIATSALLLP